MARRVNDTETLDTEPFDCISGGPAYRRWKGKALQILAGKTDESASSLADHALDQDMGGAAVGAPALPGGAQGVKMQRLDKTLDPGCTIIL